VTGERPGAPDLPIAATDEPAPTPKRAVRARRSPARRKRAKPDPARTWAKRLARTRPGLVDFVLDAVTEAYGIGPWLRVHDPTSELVLTILSQNSSDINAEHAFESLRRHYRRRPEDGGPADELTNRPGWGGSGLARAEPPDWLAVETAPLGELIDVIRSGGLAPQKAPRIQASLGRVREVRGDHSLEFLGEMAPLEARAWLTSIDGIGKKTASVVLLFAFGMDLMPVDRHVERVSKRIGLLPAKLTAEDAHDHYLALLAPGRSYPMHVGLITHGRRICHARVPACDICPIAPRCRYVDRRAP
jgi:endonuclease-3